MRWNEMDEMGDDVRGRLLSITEGSVEWINLIGSSQISHIHLHTLAEGSPKSHVYVWPGVTKRGSDHRTDFIR